uniref:Uncharacterized protein n=1 Tax=Oncorhynchus mykiss TaxID=8022 RepID=A0A8C7REX6_ONCMY
MSLSLRGNTTMSLSLPQRRGNTTMSLSLPQRRGNTTMSLSLTQRRGNTTMSLSLTQRGGNITEGGFSLSLTNPDRFSFHADTIIDAKVVSLSPTHTHTNYFSFCS